MFTYVHLKFTTLHFPLVHWHCLLCMARVEEWSFEGMYVNHMVVLFSEAKYFSPKRDFVSCKTPKRSMYSVHFATE